jgi:hypothetical protein
MSLSLCRSVVNKGVNKIKVRPSQVIRSFVDLRFWNDNTKNFLSKKDTNFLTCDYIDGRYISPWEEDSGSGTNLLNLVKWQLTKKSKKLIFASNKGSESHSAIKPVHVSQSKIFVTDRPHVTWIGHATCYFHSEGIRFITDPIFSDTCAPIEYFG